MDVEKLFFDLESNSPQEYEESKNKITETFNQTKDPWLVKEMMEYYLRTNSTRIIDVLIKVQQPHDNFVFDRLSEWIKSQQHRTAALSLFGFIVRKHPTWLHKVSKHKLMKDIFKLLQSEREIVPLMTALLCIITLLPIIPTSTQQFLPDLFDVFGHLASWNCQNPNRLCEYQIIHLQLGLHMLFHRLYGMYPWHFILYLREFIGKEKGAIFQHTIKPLLATVRIHPLLVIATKETEANTIRWKDMQPHDVVVECAKLSLALCRQDHNPDCFASVASLKCHDSTSHQQKSLLGEASFQPIAELSSPFHSLMQRDKVVNYQKFEKIWSPVIEILATPPPTGAIPHTPTPNFGVPLVTTLSNATNLLGASGSSPPEAAVEATPETTPLKDLNIKRGLITTSKPNAVRSILGSSQPSSPMRKEQSPFHFPDTSQQSSSIDFQQSQVYHNALNQTITTTTNASVANSSAITSQRFMQMINDRNLAQIKSIEALASNIKLNPLASHEIQQVSSLNSSKQLSLDSPSHLSESTREDQEVTELTSQQLAMAVSGGGPHNSDTLQDISNECDDDCDEAERSPCSAGGLHVPTNRTIQLYVNRIKRNRLATYCQNDTSSYLSYGTSPADVSTNEMLHVSFLSKTNVRRTNSWPAISRKLTADENFEFDLTGEQQDNVTSITSITQLNGDSSSPSGDDVMSAATHFKKIQQKKDRKEATSVSNKNGNKSLSKFDMIHFQNKKLSRYDENLASGCTSSNRLSNVVVTKTTTSTQTMQQWPQFYEHNLLELIVEDNKMRNSIGTTNIEPQEVLNSYIDRTVKSKYSTDSKNREDEFKEQLQLLYLQLQYEQYRREIHAERNRRLMGRSRDKRTLESENDRLRDQLRNLDDHNKSLTIELGSTRKYYKDKDAQLNKELNMWKSKYQSELEDNKQLRLKNETLQRQINEDTKNHQQINHEVDVLNGQIFDMRNELLHAQYEAELGIHYKQDLIKLETEFMIMGEVQIKCRDRLNEIDNLRVRDEELKMLQTAFKTEINEIRSSLEEKSTQLDSAKNRLHELQSQLITKEVVFTDQKRLLKSVKDEYEEKFRALNKKYEAQKAIIYQMELKILELFKNRTSSGLLSDERTEITDHTSPLSTSLASSGDGLSASFCSVTELCNLQAIVNTGNTSGDGELSSTVRNPNSSYSTSHYVQRQTTRSDYSLSRYIANPTTSSSSSSNQVSAGSTGPGGTTRSGRQSAGSLDIPVPGSSQHSQHYSAHH